MIGVDYLVEIIGSGVVFGLTPGISIGEVDARISIPFFEEVHGRAENRLLRRDYGSFELTFGGEPAWTVMWITVELHRLSSQSELIDELMATEGVKWSPYTAWDDVRKGFFERFPSHSIAEVEGQSGYRMFRSFGSGVNVVVVSDPELVRGDFPGFGDVWKVEVRMPV